MPQAQFFIACLVASFFLKTGQAIVDIFQRLSIEVDFVRIRQKC